MKSGPEQAGITASGAEPHVDGIDGVPSSLLQSLITSAGRWKQRIVYHVRAMCLGRTKHTSRIFEQVSMGSALQFQDCMCVD